MWSNSNSTFTGGLGSAAGAPARRVRRLALRARRRCVALLLHGRAARPRPPRPGASGLKRSSNLSSAELGLLRHQVHAHQLRRFGALAGLENQKLPVGAPLHRIEIAVGQEAHLVRSAAARGRPHRHCAARGHRRPHKRSTDCPAPRRYDAADESRGQPAAPAWHPDRSPAVLCDCARRPGSCRRAKT